MSSVVIAGDTSGQVTLAAPAVAGSNTATLPAATGELSMLGGSGQTYQSVTRVSGTTYTNSTGKPILLIVSYNSIASVTVTVGGVTAVTAATDGTNSYRAVSVIVPNGLTYVITATIVSVTELR